MNYNTREYIVLKLHICIVLLKRFRIIYIDIFINYSIIVYNYREQNIARFLYELKSILNPLLIAPTKSHSA